MKPVTIIAAVLSATLLMSLAACSAGDKGVETSSTKPRYIYPGEDREMTWHNPAYDNEEYAEGATLNVWVSASRDPERDYSYSGEIHWVENHNNHIFTLLCLPEEYDGSQTYPLLLLLHGYNSNFHEYDPMVNFFTEAGYAVLMFDFRGGHASNLLSDGKMTQMSYDTKLSDIRAVLSFAETIPMADKENFILIGHSQGGAMAQIVATDAELKDRFNGMLILAPAPLVTDYDVKYPSAEDIPETIQLLYSTTGRDFVYSAIIYEAKFEELTDYNKPVLILHGTADEIIKEESSRAVAEKIGDNATFQLVEGGYHDFRDDVLPWLTPETIIPFLDSLLVK